MQLGKIQIAVLFLIIANVIWGASFPVYKWALDDIPSFTFVFLRFYLAALILFPFVYKNLRIERQDWWDLFLCSFIGITITISFLILGLKLSSSINAPIILSAGPIILIIGSFFYLKERLKKKVVVGTLTSLVGVLTIVLLPVFKGGLDGGLLGNLFLVGAAIGSVIHALLLKKIMPKYKALPIAFWQFLIGSLPLLPFYFIELNQTHWTQDINLKILIGIFFGSVLATSVAHSIYAYGMKFIKASEVGIFTYVDPIATVLVAIPLLGEKITAPYLIGALFVFLGIFIAEGRIHYHPLQKLRNNL
ncbi:MAG: EamA family transporter [Candidatus Levybacteria bacterium]|nr:EamA family transporter [Candidatus Levybacteria bacterium]